MGLLGGRFPGSRPPAPARPPRRALAAVAVGAVLVLASRHAANYVFGGWVTGHDIDTDSTIDTGAAYRSAGVWHVPVRVDGAVVYTARAPRLANAQYEARRAIAAERLARVRAGVPS